MKNNPTTDFYFGPNQSYLVCQPLLKAGFSNAFSTRQGGISPLPSNALNLAYINDSSENVDENRRRFLASLGKPSAPIVTAHQTHSDQGQTILSPDIKNEPEADALLSQLKGIFLGIKTADCLPILVGDPATRTMMAIHAGWKGTLSRITLKTLTKMYQVQIKSTIAALGPAACGDCYEIGSDMVKRFQQGFKDSSEFIKKKTSQALLDLKEANKRQLIQAGVKPENIFVSDFCPLHQNELFFSYRLEGNRGKTKIGRMLSVIGQF